MTIKSVLLAFGMAALLLAAGSGHAQTQMLDQVVAIVDDDVVMASELRERVQGITQTLRSRGVEVPPEDVLIRETLDRLIIESIQLQIGNRVGARISDAQLNAAMERIAAQNQMSPEQFRVALEQEGQSYAEMREQIRREMIIQRVQSGNVNQRIQISEEEVDNFLTSPEGKKLSQPEYRVLHALLPISADAPEKEITEARAYLQQLLQRIRGGESFDQVISGNSGPYTFSGGDLGWRKLEDLPTLFSDIVPSLAVGTTSDPVRSPSGLHLVHVAEMKGGTQIVNQTKVRHILLRPSEIMTSEQAEAKIMALRERAEDGEDFGELAREHSEDIGSAAEGGDLGWTMTGQMVPEFDQAIANTETGEISDPVRTQFGWHILEILDRREQDMTQDAIRAQATDALRQRKYDEELDVWLRKIRDEAFVDIK
ncbi:molecular chaperone SurA [Kineobactrum sediminis]|uniref:Chaperone SurA n=1 Tax=Kineobactrum sediminis TaxID=1905677 RepID=A0A2N5XY35_9GAMM|nr:peptidylprolyl isomerase [Kineobactrum sediminis]PLW81058.1 molecular chaperone SurA [Kineobactrum sediminis]